MQRHLLGVAVVGAAALLLGMVGPAGAVTTTTTAPHATTTTRPQATTTARHRTSTRRGRGRAGDFEVVLGITRTRSAAARLVRSAERHHLRPGIETEGSRRHRRFEVELPGFGTRAAADRELRVVRRDGFRRAFVERS